MAANIRILQTALSRVFSKPNYLVITVAIAFNILFAYYLILIQRTTWDAFWQSNAAWYVWSQIILSIINALLAGMAASFLFYVIEKRLQGSELTSLNTLGSLFFSAAVTGCSVCSAFLLPALGIAASLAAFPFGGLEIKLFSALILLYALWQYSKSVLGLCGIPKKRKFLLNKLQPLALLALFIFTVYAIPRLPIKYRAKTQSNALAAASQLNKSKTNTADI